MFGRAFRAVLQICAIHVCDLRVSQTFNTARRVPGTMRLSAGCDRAKTRNNRGEHHDRAGKTSRP